MIRRPGAIRYYPPGYGGITEGEVYYGKPNWVSLCHFTIPGTLDPTLD